MSFFSGEFFKKKHFKAEFYGRPFFYLNSFFDDTTIAHGYTAGTLDASTIRLICTRAIVGTPAFEQCKITVEGVPVVISDIVVNGMELEIGLTPQVITAGQVIKISMGIDPSNNLGGLDNAPVANNVTAKKKKTKK